METRNQSQGYAGGRAGRDCDGNERPRFCAEHDTFGETEAQRGGVVPRVHIIGSGRAQNEHWLKVPIPRVSSKHLLVHKIVPCWDQPHVEPHPSLAKGQCRGRPILSSKVVVALLREGKKMPFLGTEHLCPGCTSRVSPLHSILPAASCGRIALCINTSPDPRWASDSYLYHTWGLLAAHSIAGGE